MSPFQKCIKVPAVIVIPVLAENLLGILLTLENAHKQECTCERKQRQERSGNAVFSYLCLASEIPWWLHHLDIGLVLVLLLDVIQTLMF